MDHLACTLPEKAYHVLNDTISLLSFHTASTLLLCLSYLQCRIKPHTDAGLQIRTICADTTTSSSHQNASSSQLVPRATLYHFFLFHTHPYLETLLLPPSSGCLPDTARGPVLYPAVARPRDVALKMLPRHSESPAHCGPAMILTCSVIDKNNQDLKRAEVCALMFEVDETLS